MKDNVLKKEFAKKDVQRIRNLVQGKTGEKVSKSIGYSKTKVHHKEGDIWEEDGRSWTITDGIRQNITKLDLAKNIHQTPLFCPNCTKPMKKHFDNSYYLIHKKCFDCVIISETEMRRLGTFDEYQRKIKNSEIDGYIQSFKDYVADTLTQSNNSFVTEQGDVETWVGGIDKERALASLEETVTYLEGLKT